MLSVEEAKEIVLNTTIPVSITEVPVSECLGLTLAQPVHAAYSLPLFDNSAMDGYAVLTKDILRASKENPVILKKLDFIPAGTTKSQALQSGFCYPIATGAPIPPGADAVVMKENTEIREEKIHFFRPAKEKENIRFQGEDISQGSQVIEAGTLVTPSHIAVLASFGYGKVPVYSPLQVSILSTGSELVDVDQPLKPGQIRDSNSYMLRALFQAEHCRIHRLGIVPDNPEKLFLSFQEGLKSDILLISGGVSVGEHDFVKDTLKKLGVEELFWKVRIKPGKPIFFGKSDSTVIFGLPGNPAASYVLFEEFVRPFIRKIMGKTPLEKGLVQAVSEGAWQQRSGRKQFLRAKLTKKNGEYRVHPFSKQGSHSLASLVGANALMIVETNTTAIKIGDQVLVRALQDI